MKSEFLSSKEDTSVKSERETGLALSLKLNATEIAPDQY